MLQGLTYAQIESISHKGKSRLLPFLCPSDNTGLWAGTRAESNHAPAYEILATC